MMMERFFSLLVVCAATVALAGCGAVVPARYTVEDKAESVRQGPESAPQKNMTSMADCLRCMDRLLLEYDIRDVVVLTEDLVDNTKKLNVGARDMLISAVSDMTKRSHAIRLITFGGDQANLVNWHNASGVNDQIYTFVPDFDIRGSISQVDDNLAQQRENAGFTLAGVDFDWSDDAKASIIALDMSVVSTRTMELLPGVISRNSILVVKDGTGVGGGATGTISKEQFGINYDFSFNRNEGSAQAVRTLIELAAIELFGRLTRIPYWNCLGIDPNHPLIKDEIGDWYYTLSRENKLIPYVKNQLRIRNVYSGPLDNKLNPEFLNLIPRARRALGLRDGGNIDEELFAGLINLKTKGLGFPSDSAANLTQAQKVEKRKGKGAEKPKSKPKPRKVEITSKPIKPNQDISLIIRSQEDSHLYCYLNEPETNSWLRIYPNRYSSDSWVGKNSSIEIPGKAGFKIVAGHATTEERVYCFSTLTDVFPALPVSAKGADFEPLADYDLDKLRSVFAAASNDAVAESSVKIVKR